MIIVVFAVVVAAVGVVVDFVSLFLWLDYYDLKYLWDYYCLLLKHL